MSKKNERGKNLRVKSKRKSTVEIKRKQIVMTVKWKSAETNSMGREEARWKIKKERRRTNKKKPEYWRRTMTSRLIVLMAPLIWPRTPNPEKALQRIPPSIFASLRNLWHPTRRNPKIRSPGSILAVHLIGQQK